MLCVVNINLYLPPPSPLYLTTSLSIVICCIHLSFPTSSSSLSNYLSNYLLLYVVNINLCLPPPQLYLTFSLSIYCFILCTSTCTYLFFLSILLSIYLYQSTVLSCIHLSVPNSSSSSLSYYLSINLLFKVVFIYLCLPPPPSSLYLTTSLTIYCS